MKLLGSCMVTTITCFVDQLNSISAIFINVYDIKKLTTGNLYGGMWKYIWLPGSEVLWVVRITCDPDSTLI